MDKEGGKRIKKGEKRIKREKEKDKEGGGKR